MARESRSGCGTAGMLAVSGLVGMVIGVVGVVSITGMYALITSEPSEGDPVCTPEENVMVMVAARDLLPGVTIAEPDLYAVLIPPEYLPEGVFLSPKHVIGRTTGERILAQEYLRSGRLVDPEPGAEHEVDPPGAAGPSTP